MALSSVTTDMITSGPKTVRKPGQPDASEQSASVCLSRAQEVLNCCEEAMAILDPELDRICWSTASWANILPSLSMDAVWSSELAASSQLAAAYSAFAEQQQSDVGQGDSHVSEVRCRTSGQIMRVSWYALSDGAIVLKAQRPSHALGDMHLYMQNRENMFTTSRTISVSEMATTLAHEIKQPIATISNILKGVRLRLKREDLSAQQLDDSLANALEQTQFTNSVINRIRDFTQARRPQQQQLDLLVVTREAMSLMDWLLSANQCRTELVIKDESLLCEGDPTMLQQVLVNLLRNGVEAMHDSAVQDRLLVISCERRDARVRVNIKDSGKGLEGNEQTLFVPFTTSKANGMGVGLNICRSFVELHQGKLWLSQNEDGGCTSHVELPLAIGSSDSAARQQTGKL